MYIRDSTLSENEFIIPTNIVVKSDDILLDTKPLYNISFSGSLMPQEFFLHEFKEESNIYQYGHEILKCYDKKKYNLLYVPNKEWYNIFRIVNYIYN